MRISSIAACVILKITSNSFGCGIDWRLPATRIDGVNDSGRVSVWETVGEIDMGGGLLYPIHINFNSGRSEVSPYLGRGWTLALLESRVVQRNEREFTVYEPNGRSRRFFRSKTDPKILLGQGDWRAEIKGDAIQVWSDCGWKLTYRNGKIETIVSPEGRALEYVRSSGKVVELRDAGTTRLKVGFDPTSGLASSLEFNGKLLPIQLSSAPRVEVVQGKSLVGGVDPVVSRVGNGRGYTFGVNERINPFLSIEEKERQRSFYWNPETKLVTLGDDWTYNLVPANFSKARSAIRRKDKQGREESWSIDNELGKETIALADGRVTETRWFTNGKLSGLLRYSAERIPGQPARVRSYSYDEFGRKIREQDDKGKIWYEAQFDPQGRRLMEAFDGRKTEWRYEEHQKVILTTMPSGIVYSRVIDDQGKLKTLQSEKAK